jgi:hypothetical protein
LSTACSVRFFVNGTEFGTAGGGAGGGAGSGAGGGGFRLPRTPVGGLVLGVELYYKTQQVTIVKHAKRGKCVCSPDGDELPLPANANGDVAR